MYICIGICYNLLKMTFRVVTVRSKGPIYNWEIIHHDKLYDNRITDNAFRKHEKLDCVL